MVVLCMKYFSFEFTNTLTHVFTIEFIPVSTKIHIHLFARTFLHLHLTFTKNKTKQSKK